MKTLNLVLIGMSLLPAVVQARTTNSPNSEPIKPLNNPIYSVNNYKQPNLAVAALRWENKEAVKVKKLTPDEIQLANYKKYPPTTEIVSSIILPHIPQNNLSNRNYKTPNLSELKSTDSDGSHHVKKHHKHDHTTVGR